MLRNQFIRQIVSFEPSSTVPHECRHCEYSVEETTDECPKCDSHKIAASDLE